MASTPTNGSHVEPSGAAVPIPGRGWVLFVVFAVVYAFFISAPAVFHQEFPLRRDIEWGDVLDIATPFLVFTLAWALIRAAVGGLSGGLGLAFLILAVAWTQGQGMHLASNSIGHQVPENASGDLPEVIHFYDEQLSHYIWYLGVGLLPLFLLVVLWRGQPSSDAGTARPVLIAGVIYGVSLGLSSLEAAVVPLTFSLFAATLVFAAFLYRSAPRLRRVELFHVLHDVGCSSRRRPHRLGNLLRRLARAQRRRADLTPPERAEEIRALDDGPIADLRSAARNWVRAPVRRSGGGEPSKPAGVVRHLGP